MIDTKALRQKILDMAIKGKLVPQDPNDEPASVLLERIRAEKQQLIKEGKIKKDKHDSVIFKGDDNRYYEKVGSEVKDITEDLPFEIPDSWVWTRFSTLIRIISGVSYDKNDVATKGIRILRGGNINDLGVTPFSDDVYLPETYYDPDKQVQIDDVLIVASTGSKEVIGKAGYVIEPLENTQIGAFLRIVRPLLKWYAPYVKLIFATEYYREHIRHLSGGTNINNIKADYINAFLISLPPYAEQARIVKRIEELFTQVDAIEQNQADIDTLYEEFRKRTLTLAIQGKLVPQDPNDEPASVLLECIRAEKKAKLGKKYADSYIYKGDDNCYYEKVGENVTTISDEIPFDLPENWAWCRLQMICSYIHRGKSPTYGTENILPIIAQKCNQWSGIQTQKCLFADRAAIKKYTEEQYLCVGDIIINSTGTGTVGRTGYVDDTLFKEYPKFVADSHVTVVRPLEYIDSKYIYLFLKSPVIQTDIEAKCSGSTNQIELATKTIQSYLIPLPPVMEQHRIASMFFTLEARLKDKD